MTSKTVTSLAFAAGCVLALGAMPPAHAQNYPQQPQPYAGPQINMPAQSAPRAWNGPAPTQPMERQAFNPPETMLTNGPQASRGDLGDWSARQNVIESARYDRLLETSWAFRQARMGKECGPINDPQLHEQCMASFQQYEPAMVGSSIPPVRYYRGAGY